MYGVTEAGFNKKPFDVIMTEINQSLAAVFGEPNTETEAVFGQISGVLGEIVSDLWDLAEANYNSQYPNSALGVALDNALQFNNLIRLDATNSSAHCILEGDEGTTIPAETLVRQTVLKGVFSTYEEIEITKLNALKYVIQVDNPTTSYHTITFESVLIDGLTRVYTSLEIGIEAILNDFTNQINIDDDFGKAEYDVDNNRLIVTAKDNKTPFGSPTNYRMTSVERWTPVIVNAIETGAKAVPANTIDEIETPVTGLNSVDNLLVGVQGRSTETDDEVRLRRKQSLRVVGAATVPSIEARLLQEVEEVTAVSVKDNRKDIEVDGRPPHSIEAIITYPEGDTVVEQAIADKLWEVGGGGIATHGDILKTITDSSGDEHAIYFSRPIDKYIHINAEITLNDEEVFPVDGIEQIKEALAEYGNTLKASEDIIRQKFFNSFYVVEGVEDITLYEHDATDNPGDTPSYVTTNLPMSDTEIARFNVDRIHIVIV